MSHPHRLLPNTAPTSKCLWCVFLSLLATGVPVTPPEPGPAPSQASGFRPSGLLTPVSPGVPTGARNLGVCVFAFQFLRSLLSPLLPHSRLPLAVWHSTSATVLSFSRNPLSTPHPLLPPPILSFTPSTHAPSCFPRVLPTKLHGPSASPVWDLRRRWKVLIVRTETEPVHLCFLSPHLFRMSRSHLYFFHPLCFSPDIQQYRV